MARDYNELFRNIKNPLNCCNLRMHFTRTVQSVRIRYNEARETLAYEIKLRTSRGLRIIVTIPNL